MYIYIYICIYIYTYIYIFIYLFKHTPKPPGSRLPRLLKASKAPSRRGLCAGRAFRQLVLHHVAPHGGHEATFTQGLRGADHVFGVPPNGPMAWPWHGGQAWPKIKSMAFGILFLKVACELEK